MSERVWDRRRERGREDHKRERERRERKQNERASKRASERAPLASVFSVSVGLARRLNLSYGQVSRPVTRQLNNAIRTNCRYVVRAWSEERGREEEGEARETNERKQHRSKHTTVYAPERSSCTDTLGTDASDRETRAVGISRRPFSSPVRGLRTRHTTHDRRVSPAREETSVIVANQHSRGTIGVRFGSGRALYQRSSRLTPTRCGVVGKTSVFLRVYVIFERELRCRIVATVFAAIFIVYRCESSDSSSPSSRSTSFVR